MTLLSDKRILEFIGWEKIVIDPFNEKNLGNCSYDVTLGEFFYLEKNHDGLGFHNPYSKESVQSMWAGPYTAKKLSFLKQDDEKFRNYITDLGRHSGFAVTDRLLESIVNNKFENVNEDDKIIFLFPGQNMLGHTIEYIGGVERITTKMLSRSSMGRNNVTVCRDAGKGDVGYINRWTMEITNNNKHQVVPLIVGRRIAQIEFYDVGIANKDYSIAGHYQMSSDLEDLKKNWKTELMLPQLWNSLT